MLQLLLAPPTRPSLPACCRANRVQRHRARGGDDENCFSVVLVAGRRHTHTVTVTSRLSGVSYFPIFFGRSKI